MDNTNFSCEHEGGGVGADAGFLKGGSNPGKFEKIPKKRVLTFQEGGPPPETWQKCPKKRSAPPKKGAPARKGGGGFQGYFSAKRGGPPATKLSLK